MTDGRPEPGPDGLFTKDDYNDVAAHAQLLAVSLLKAESEIKPEYFNPATKKNLSYATATLSSAHIDEEQSMSAVFQFVVEGKVGRKKLLKIYAEFFVVFGCGSNHNPEAAKAFCEHIGLYAAYPYFRSWVAQVACAAGVKLPPLPTLSSVGRGIPGAKQVETSATGALSSSDTAQLPG